MEDSYDQYTTIDPQYHRQDSESSYYSSTDQDKPGQRKRRRGFQVFREFWLQPRKYTLIFRLKFDMDSQTSKTALFFKFCSEFIGTLLFVFFGCGSMCGYLMLKGAEKGIWQVAVVWGLGLGLGIYITCGISGGHLNPAVTMAFAIFRRKSFPWINVFPYLIGQLLGGYFAGLLVWGVYDPFIKQFENSHQIVRGDNRSYVSASIFSGYFPNPGAYPYGDGNNANMVTAGTAFGIEVLGTLFLVLIIFVLTHENYQALGKERAGVPILIGLTLAALICLFGTFTECSLNPARDLGPRLAAVTAGWGSQAIPGPRNGFWIYQLAPPLGALGGAFLAEFAVGLPLRRIQARAGYETVE